MAQFVLDASLTLAWCFEDETTPFTDAVQDALRLGDVGLVPPIWPSEVANGIRTAERRGRLSESQGDEYLSLLLRLPIRMVTVSPAQTFRPVLRLARRHGVTAYDASYLELALHAGLPLATLDQPLRAAAIQVGVSLLEHP